MFIYRFLFILFFISFSFSLCAKNFTFKHIHFYGLNYLSEEFIFNNMYDFDFSEDHNNIYDDIFLKKINDLNLFNKIDIYWNSNEIKVFVVEKPLINSIKLNIDADKDFILSLLNKFKIQRGEFYDPSNLIHIRYEIQESFVSTGYHKFDLSFIVDTNNDLNTVDINVSFSKNSVQKIKNIDIIGAKSFSKNKLLSCLSYNTTSWMSFFLKNDVFMPDFVENDIDNLKIFYLDNGYSDFQIDSIRAFVSENNSIDILINIFEGEKFFVWSIDLIGDKSIFNSKSDYYIYRDILYSSLSEGEYFSRQKLIDIRTKLKEYLSNIGYLNSDINFSAYYIGESRVKVDFIFNKTVRAIVRHINFLGNYFTCDNVLRRMLPIIEGSTISIDDLELGKEEIIRNGVSDSVSFDYIRNPNNFNEVDIIYFIEEQKFGKMTAGFSYGNDDGLSINLNADFANFLGIGNDISIELNINGVESDFRFTYYTPYFFDKKFGVGYNIYYTSEVFDQDIDDFDILTETFGAYLYYSFEISKYDRLNFGIGCDMTFLGMCDEFVSDEIKFFVERFGFDFKEYYFNFIWLFNSLNKLYNPNSGAYHSLNFRFNIPYSKSKYYTFVYDFNYYNNFYNDFVLNVSSSLYFGNVYDNISEYPFFKNFHIRGSNSIRGFKERSLGPLDSNEETIGGNLLLCSKFSLYFPNPLSSKFDDVRTALFFDIGQVYNTLIYSEDDFRNKFYYYVNSLKFSLGIALVWNTPFGIPLEISLAYPFNIEDEDSKNIFSISFG